jgi:REP element-mobilizing transposase RayT
LRIEFPGGLFHVTSRGDRREPIDLEDADRRQWLTLLGQVCDRFNWLCHAYCLMGNHFHIVVETVEGNLGAGMRQLNGVYTQWHNRAHNRVGHVFQGRFKAIIVQREAYLLELARYVVLNQVRAGIGLPPVWDGLKNQLYLGDQCFAQKLQLKTQSQATQTEIPGARHEAQVLSFAPWRCFSQIDGKTKILVSELRDCDRGPTLQRRQHAAVAASHEDGNPHGRRSCCRGGVWGSGAGEVIFGGVAGGGASGTAV